MAEIFVGGVVTNPFANLLGYVFNNRVRVVR